jgi:CRP-like cAMP-binding protein
MRNSVTFTQGPVWPRWPLALSDRPLTRYRRDQVLYIEGETIRDVSLLQSGIVRVSVADRSHDVCVALRTPGWLIGATSAVTGSRHLSTVCAMSDCLVHRIPVDDFHQRRGLNTDLSSAIQQMFASELHWQNERAARIGARQHRGALEHLLRELFAAAGSAKSDGSVWLEIGLSVTDIAAMIGVTRPWAAVLLAELGETGALSRRKGRLIAPNGSFLLSTHAATTVKTLGVFSST